MHTPGSILCFRSVLVLVAVMCCTLVYRDLDVVLGDRDDLDGSHLNRKS